MGSFEVPIILALIATIWIFFQSALQLDRKEYGLLKIFMFVMAFWLVQFMLGMLRQLSENAGAPANVIGLIEGGFTTLMWINILVTVVFMWQIVFKMFKPIYLKLRAWSTKYGR